MCDSAGLILQHEPDAPPALLGDWLRERGVEAQIVRSWADPPPADPAGARFVVSLGSFRSATQSDGWVPDQVELLGRAVAAEVPTLAICFGAQALSRALGGEISPHDPLQMGWLEIDTADPELVPSGPWFGFNGEVFSVPDGATELARVPGGPAAFSYGSALAVQFHPEVTPAIAEGWAAQDPDRLAQGGLDTAGLEAQGRQRYPAAREQAWRLFDAWRERFVVRRRA